MLEQLKKHVILHAKSQNMSENECNLLLKKINSFEGTHRESWVYEFTERANQYLTKKNYLMAFQHYNLARFPFIDSTAKYEAHQKCIFSFLEFCASKKIPIEKKSIEKGTWFFYYLENKNRNAPLLLVLGGIVSLKEQWHNMITLAQKLNFHLVLTEMPGVGENTTPYTALSYTQISKIIDSLSLNVNMNEVHILAMSFSGTLAMKSAIYDKRIKSIFTIGSPIYHFFKDKIHWEKVPIITQLTLAHILKCSKTEVFNVIEELALLPEELGNINIPVCYINSAYDDIIPQTEVSLLNKHLACCDVIEFMDEHGSPRHLNKIKFAFLNFICKHSTIRMPFMSYLFKLMYHLSIAPHKKPLRSLN